MWIEVKETKEYIPFNEEKTEKVYFDGKKGWAIKQKDGNVYHVPQETFDKKMLRELDSEAFWKMQDVERNVNGLTEKELKKVKAMIAQAEKKKKEEEEE